MIILELFLYKNNKYSKGSKHMNLKHLSCKNEIKKRKDIYWYKY